MRAKVTTVALLSAMVAGLAGAGVSVLDPGDRAYAQAGGSTMQERLDQIIRVLQEAPPCSTAQGAIADGMEILYGGLRILPTGGEAREQSEAADEATRQNEQRFAGALERYASTAGACEAGRDAIDLKLFIEQMDEVARAVGEVTRECGSGDSLDREPCDQLKPLLNEGKGREFGAQGSRQRVIQPGYAVKLRSPFIPPFFPAFQEATVVTPTVGRGQCAAVFKETRGLTVRLRFAGITIVGDPWVNVFGVPRGTRVPIWRLEWVPSEYIKEFNICNVDGRIVKTVTQRVVQDVALNFFWRYYQKN